ncbi:MAG: 50S ribosomal protein L19 [Candidatus Xenobia bacterium]
MDVIAAIEREEASKEIPPFRAGDTVRVSVKIEADTAAEKEKKDKKAKQAASGKGVQAFEGICIARRGKGARESATLRKVSNGVGVERTFLLQSPKVTKIEVVRRGDVSRARLFYLREKVGKAARVKEKRFTVPSSGPTAQE